MHHVTLIQGDGTGPELCEAARRCIDATGVAVAWDVRSAGVEILAKEGTVVPQSTLESIRRTKVALKGPVSTPPAPGHRRVADILREELDLFASVRPCKTYKGVPSNIAHAPVDLVIVRENTEDLYCGVEFERDKDETRSLIEWLNNHRSKKLRADSGISIKAISVACSRRIVKFAFDYARKMGRRKITAVHKANILRHTDGLFLSIARDVAKDYPDIGFEDRIIDNMCMQLVQKPEQHDVLVLPNLYGDIVSDLAAGLTGGLGVAAGANIGEKGAVFEATHGSAPKYKGQNKVNPTALILSGMLMLQHLGETSAARRLERAIAAVLAEGVSVTYDLKPNREDPTAVGTSQMADAIIAKLRSMPDN